MQFMVKKKTNEIMHSFKIMHSLIEKILFEIKSKYIENSNNHIMIIADIYETIIVE